MERHIQKVQGQVRTIKSHLEHEIGMQIESGHPIMAWMVQWAAECLSRFEIGPDGRTSHQRLHGRRSQRTVACYGEKVLYMPRKTAKNHKNKEQPRWEFGFWLGLTQGGEAIIRTSKGVIKTRAENVKANQLRERDPKLHRRA